jgi:hypothetical protein
MEMYTCTTDITVIKASRTDIGVIMAFINATSSTVVKAIFYENEISQDSHPFRIFVFREMIILVKM